MAEAPPIDDPSTLIDHAKVFIENCDNHLKFGLCLLNCKVGLGSITKSDNPSSSDPETAEVPEEAESDEEESLGLSEGAKQIGGCLGYCYVMHCTP
jgi:hypothetical protein